MTDGYERDSDELPAGLSEVLDSAAELQRLVPGAVLVGGSAAALYAGHRLSYDHDHVLTDLRDRYDVVLDALEREGDFVLNRAVPGKIILGELGGIETGIRQLLRARPLELQEVTLTGGRTLVVPTPDETLRIKGFLIVKRNQVRDYLDVAALSARYGLPHAGSVLARIDDYYSDETRAREDQPVRSQLIRQLALPEPKDSRVIRSLSSYKSLERRWHEWSSVVDQCARLSTQIATEGLD